MSKQTLTLVANMRPHMCDGVEVTKENNFFTVYRYIEDSDEEGDTIYSIDEYLKMIPEADFKREIRANWDGDVIFWIRTHLIEESSNSLDAIIAFLDEHKVPYQYEADF